MFVDMLEETSPAIKIAVATAMFAGLGTAAAIGIPSVIEALRSQPDLHTLCGGTILRHEAVFIDHSSAIGEGKRKAYREDFKARVVAAPAGTRFTVYRLTPEGGDSFVEVLFSRCKPKLCSEGEELTCTARVRMGVYREKFAAPMMAAFDQVFEAGESKSSPIIEGLYAIAHDPGFREGERRLSILSDFKENSRIADHYKSTPRYDVLAKRYSTVFKGLSGLDGVSVRTVDIAVEHPARERFWRTLFEKAGAKLSADRI